MRRPPTPIRNRATHASPLQKQRNFSHPGSLLTMRPMNHPIRRSALLLLVLVAPLCIAASAVYADESDTPPPPASYSAPPVAPPPSGYPPPGYIAVRPLPEPPPLSPVMRVIYAPFYAAGLVVRYGLYYGLVAPFEVFGRALSYGVSGGVDDGTQVQQTR